MIINHLDYTDCREEFKVRLEHGYIEQNSWLHVKLATNWCLSNVNRWEFRYKVYGYYSLFTFNNKEDAEIFSLKWL